MPTCVFCGDQVATETTHKSWGDCIRVLRRRIAQLEAELATYRPAPAAEAGPGEYARTDRSLLLREGDSALAWRG